MMTSGRAFLAITASLLAVLSGVCVNFAVKYAADADVPQHTVLFYRFFGGVILLTPILFWQGRKAWVSYHPWLQGGRAVMMIASIALFFWTISRMPVGVAGAIQNLSPLFIPLGGWLLLHEKLSLRLFLPVIVGLIGAIIATESSVPQGDVLILAAGVLSAALGGMTAPLGKYLQKHDNLTVLVTWPAFAGLVFAGGWSVVDGFIWPEVKVMLALSVAGAMGYMGWFLTQWAYTILTSAAIAPIRYMAIPINLFGAMIFFGEKFTLVTLSGVALIFVGCLLPWVRFRRLRVDLKLFQRWIPPK